MTNYHKTFRNIFYFVIAIQASLILFGYLRPSILYDYLDNWPLSLLPLFVVLLNKVFLGNLKINNYIYGFLIFIYSLFPVVLLSNSETLTTNTINSGFESLNFEEGVIYNVKIDLDGSINLNSFNGSGYIVDIQNRPGNIGYPEAIESNLGEPRLIQFRELETDRLLQVRGWDIKLGSETLWSLNLLSFESVINLDNLNLVSSEIIGTGEISLGKNLKSTDLIISGNFYIIVDNDLPIVVIGKAEVPAEWINATIGYLNQTNENYKFKVIVEEGSNVVFQDGE